MADIILFGDKHKRILKIAEGWVRKKLGASVITVHNDLQNCGNPIFSRIDALINTAADSVQEKYQEHVIRDFGELLLWILYKDTAYRDPTFWILYQLLDNADVIKKELKMYVKEPKDWYVNAWHDSKEHTKKEREKGNIPNTKKSLDESIFTPPEQLRRLKKYKVK